MKERLFSDPRLPVLMFVFVSIIAGFLVVDDYGDSWDERARLAYAEQSLSAYTGNETVFNDEKGPFYVMFAKLGSDFIRIVRPDWRSIQAWHVIHFLTFILGTVFLYKLSRYFMSPGAAYLTLILFTTQPLLWGHAFINPKDIPFMSFFLGGITLGFSMIDDSLKSVPRLHPVSFQKTLRVIRLDWGSSRTIFKFLLVSVGLISLGSLFILVFGREIIQQVLVNWISMAYSAERTSLLGQLFQRFAENSASVPLPQYQAKALKLYPQLVLIYLQITLIINILLSALVFRSILGPLIGAVWLNIKNPLVILAAIFLGLSTSIRVLGPFCGLLVGGYFVLKGGRNALPPLVAYFSIAMIATYITWPGIWEFPFLNLIKNLSTSSEYPWELRVLFDGKFYRADALPTRYFPTLLTIQFTEPVILLFFLGFLSSIWASTTRRKGFHSGLVFILIWLVAPLSVATIWNIRTYDNFRHFLFAIPPIFIVAGIGFDFILRSVQNKTGVMLIALIVLLPGLFSLVNLHPYQYTYYNSLVDGPGGAMRRYELDYWATSYREVTSVLNQFAPTDSLVAVWGPAHIVESYSRQDLKIIRYNNPAEVVAPVDYAVLPTRLNKDLRDFPEGREIYHVGRGGGKFAVVKELSINP